MQQMNIWKMQKTQNIQASGARAEGWNQQCTRDDRVNSDSFEIERQKEILTVL